MLKAAFPLGHVKICITEPSVAVISGTAPLPLRHMIVKVDINFLLCELGSDSIVDLGGVS
jgi:hypothetical protein